MMIRTILAMLAAAGVGIGVAALALARPDAAEGRGVHATSELASFSFDAQPLLTDAPRDAAASADCAALPVKPTSDAAREVARRGWPLVGEAPLGPYRAVSFAAGMEGGTSGTCIVHGGRIGIFAGARLVALLRSRDDDTGIGRVYPQGRAAVRIEDGNIGATPAADLTALPDGSLRLTRLPKRESVCGGRASVPAIARLPIDKARAVLIAAGWTPILRPRPADPRGRALAARGFTEVRTCLGTGLGFCEFDYRSAAGELAVTTIGDDDLPIVQDHDVRCRR